MKISLMKGSTAKRSSLVESWKTSPGLKVKT